jgi:hypothetical protein
MAQTATAAAPAAPIEHRNNKTHTPSHKLEDQAATAALYVTNVTKQDNLNNRNGYDILDADHKLSSAGESNLLKREDCDKSVLANISNNRCCGISQICTAS